MDGNDLDKHTVWLATDRKGYHYILSDVIMALKWYTEKVKSELDTEDILKCEIEIHEGYWSCCYEGELVASIERYEINRT
jgi:frataxin-like iron-binding protein CyaY